MKFKIVTNRRDWIEEAEDRDIAETQANAKRKKGEMILFVFKQDW